MMDHVKSAELQAEVIIPEQVSGGPESCRHHEQRADDGGLIEELRRLWVVLSAGRSIVAAWAHTRWSRGEI